MELDSFEAAEFKRNMDVIDIIAIEIRHFSILGNV